MRIGYGAPLSSSAVRSLDSSRMEVLEDPGSGPWTATMTHFGAEGPKEPQLHLVSGRLLYSRSMDSLEALAQLNIFWIGKLHRSFDVIQKPLGGSSQLDPLLKTKIRTEVNTGTVFYFHRAAKFYQMKSTE